MIMLTAVVTFTTYLGEHLRLPGPVQGAGMQQGTKRAKICPQESSVLIIEGGEILNKTQ